MLAFKLHSLGLVQLQGNYVTPRFDLYRQYFRGKLSSPLSVGTPGTMNSSLQELENPLIGGIGVDQPNSMLG
jgi:hypothetical protein